MKRSLSEEKCFFLLNLMNEYLLHLILIFCGSIQMQHISEYPKHSFQTIFKEQFVLKKKHLKILNSKFLLSQTFHTKLVSEKIHTEKWDFFFQWKSIYRLNWTKSNRIYNNWMFDIWQCLANCWKVKKSIEMQHLNTELNQISTRRIEII